MSKQQKDSRAGGRDLPRRVGWCHAMTERNGDGRVDVIAAGLFGVVARADRVDPADRRSVELAAAWLHDVCDPRDVRFALEAERMRLVAEEVAR